MITIIDINKILQIPAFVNAFLFAVERKMCPSEKISSFIFSNKPMYYSVKI